MTDEPIQVYRLPQAYVDMTVGMIASPRKRWRVGRKATRVPLAARGFAASPGHPSKTQKVRPARLSSGRPTSGLRCVVLGKAIAVSSHPDLKAPLRELEGDQAQETDDDQAEAHGDDVEKRVERSDASLRLIRPGEATVANRSGGGTDPEQNDSGPRRRGWGPEP
jgi:hypothetical protein